MERIQVDGAVSHRWFGTNVALWSFVIIAAWTCVLIGALAKPYYQRIEQEFDASKTKEERDFIAGFYFFAPMALMFFSGLTMYAIAHGILTASSNS